MGFTLERHKTCKTPISYIETIVAGKYYTTISKIAKTLDMKEQYIQYNYMQDLDTLYIDNGNKMQVKLILKDYRDGCLFDTGLNEIIVELQERKDILRKRVLISDKSFEQLILKTFKKEIKLPTGETITEPIDQQDLELILKHGLYSQRRAKQLLDCDHDMQLYRRLTAKNYRKYIIEEPSKKYNTARYLFL